MTQEVGRRLVNGEWVTNIADESAGGGSLPDGWVANDPTAGNLASHGGYLYLGTGGLNTEGGTIETTGGEILTAGGDVDIDGGTLDVGGGTVDLDGGTLANVGALTAQAPLTFEFDLNMGEYEVVNFTALRPHTVPTVAVDLAAIHAALVTIGLIQAP